ncbi:hypothetical protein BDZ91DRAFT_765812 [Kalaharituber pfeilii]|nr:hypothetical protein BDZ91DRAFT_765812 [Kalaharituber pfeilii]
MHAIRTTAAPPGLLEQSSLSGRSHYRDWLLLRYLLTCFCKSVNLLDNDGNNAENDSTFLVMEKKAEPARLCAPASCLKCYDRAGGRALLRRWLAMENNQIKPSMQDTSSNTLVKPQRSCLDPQKPRSPYKVNVSMTSQVEL